MLFYKLIKLAELLPEYSWDIYKIGSSIEAAESKYPEFKKEIQHLLSSGIDEKNLLWCLSKLKSGINIENIINVVLEKQNNQDPLITKLNFPAKIAKLLRELFGPRAIWVANSIIKWDKANKIISELSYDKDNSVSLSDLLQMTTFEFSMFFNLPGVSDYISVALDNDISSLENIHWNKITQMADEWHNNLEMSNESENYIEKNPIILDFRKNDIGYYWAYLGEGNSEEESERMGHCGGSNGEHIYSLRSNFKNKSGVIINKSHLTMGMNYIGIVSEFKGPKNSKPKSEYHPYIMKLIEHGKIENENNELVPLINKFDHSGYKPESDFHLNDLDDKNMKELYKSRPELFKNIPEKYALLKRNIVSKNDVFNLFNFHLDISPYEIDKYVYSDFDLESMMNNYGLDFYSDDIEPAMYYDIIDDQNKNKILKIWLELEPDANLNFEQISNNFKNDSIEIPNEINSCIISAANDALSNKCSEVILYELKNVLKAYGNVDEISFDKIKITGNLLNFNMINYLLDNDSVYHVEHPDDAADYFDLLLSEEIIQKVSINIRRIEERVYIDDNNFNENLKSNLESGF